ncbi:MAG: diaminopimelate decarboxylase [Clostridia bacterium]|nr:diaminopimelate decarboxylase [Clostridia bacterium]
MKSVPFTKEQIQNIIKKYPTPFYIYDEKGILDNLHNLQDAFSWNPGFREYFAVKALPTPAILRLLMEEGCGLDCSSLTELMLADRLQAKGEDIMFSSNATPAEEYVYARKLNAIINLDDISHIEFLEKNGGIPETICLRYNPGGELMVGNNVMGNPGDAKYGMTREQLSLAVWRLLKLGVKHFGLHAFLASNVTDPYYYPYLANLLFETAVEIHKETDAHFSFINLSGGIGIPYLPDQNKVDISLVGERVHRAYQETIEQAGMDPISLKLELGRFITGPYGYLVTTVLHEKNIYKHYLGLDACAANLMRPAMYGSYHHITVMGKENLPCDTKYDVTGSLCENNDKFAIDRMLPHVDIGDILVLHDTGAHGHSMGYNYNGRLRSAELLLHEDGTVDLIRRAETPQDYFATIEGF